MPVRRKKHCPPATPIAWRLDQVFAHCFLFSHKSQCTRLEFHGHLQVKRKRAGKLAHELFETYSTLHIYQKAFATIFKSQREKPPTQSGFGSIVTQCGRRGQIGRQLPPNFIAHFGSATRLFGPVYVRKKDKNQTGMIELQNKNFHKKQQEKVLGRWRC